MPASYKGLVFNNLAMWHYFKLSDIFTFLKEPFDNDQKFSNITHYNYEEALINLKKSVHAFEKFDIVNAELKDKNLEQELALRQDDSAAISKIQAKLFTDEFFNLERPGELLPDDLKHYDFRQPEKSESVLLSAIHSSASILPIQNLSEIAFAMKCTKEAYALNDIVRTLYNTHKTYSYHGFRAQALGGLIIDHPKVLKPLHD